MWDETADVIVVGSGFAGLAAAIEAKLMGADVLSVRKKRDWASRNSRGGFSAKTHKSQSKKHHVVLCAPASLREIIHPETLPFAVKIGSYERSRLIHLWMVSQIVCSRG